MQLSMAPMEGLTTFVYRNAFAKYYGGIDTYYTPFLASPSLNHKEYNDVCPKHNEGLHVIPQLLTNRSDVFLSLADQLAELGYKEVNLNLGCPSGTVVAKGRGAGLLEDPQKLDNFLSEIFEKCPLKISLKTRIGMEELWEWEDLLAIYAKYPFSELIIHPRLRKEFYQGTPHIESFLQATKTQFRSTEEEKKLPFSKRLCYNGDITSIETLQAVSSKLAFSQTTTLPKAASQPIFLQESASQQSDAEHYMLGRGLLRNPTLARQLKKLDSATIPPSDAATELSSDPFTTITSATTSDDLKRFWQFHDEILAGYTELMSGSQPVLFRMKELWSYMRDYVNLSDKQMKQLQKTKKTDDYKDLILQFRSSVRP